MTWCVSTSVASFSYHLEVDAGNVFLDTPAHMAAVTCAALTPLLKSIPKVPKGFAPRFTQNPVKHRVK